MIKIEDVIAALREQKLPVATLKQIETKLEEIEQDRKGDRPSGPRPKKQFCVIALDPEGKLANVPDFTALVVQIPDDVAAAEALTKLYAGVYDHNANTRSGRKAPVDTLGTAADTVKAKSWRAQSLYLKTREPVLVLRSDNKVPTK